MTYSYRRNTAGLALLIAVAALALLINAAAQELKPKGEIVIKKTLPGGIAFSPDGRYVAINGVTGDFDVDKQALDAGGFKVNMSNLMHVILLAEASSGKVTRQLFKGPEEGMGMLFGGYDPSAFSSDGRLVMAVFKNAIQVWEAEKGKKVGAWGRDLQKVVFSHDRQFALAKHSDDTIEAIDLKDGHILGSFKSDGEAQLVPLASEKPSIVFLRDQIVILKNLRTGDEISLGQLPGKRITSAAISPNGDMLAAGTDTFNIAVWSLGEKKKLFERSGDGEKGAGDSIFSPDSSTLIYQWKGQLAVRSLANETESVVSYEHPFGIGGWVFINPRTLATTGSLMDARIKLWSLSPAAGAGPAPVAGPAPAAIHQPAAIPAEASSVPPTVSWASWGILGVQRRSSAYEGMSPGPALTPGNIYLEVALQLVNASGEKAEFKYPHAGIFLRQIGSGQSIRPRDITNEALRNEVGKYRQKGLFQNLAKDFVFSVNFAIDPGKKEEFSLVFELPENAPVNDFEICLPNSQPRSLSKIGPAVSSPRPSGQAASVEGTTWDSEDSTGQQKYYEFQKGGKLVQYTSNERFPNGTWKQEGDRLSFEVNEGYVTFEARIEGDRFEGNAQPRFGSGWTLTAVRRGSAGSKPVPSAKKAAVSDDSQGGFSLTVNRSGKLIAVNGVSEESRGEWENLARRVVQLHDQAKFSEALPVAKKALDIAEQNFGPNDAHVAISLNSLANIHNSVNNYDAAVPLAQRAVALYEKLEGPEHAAVGNALNTLGIAFSGQENYVEAEDVLERAIAITEKAKGPKDEQLGTIYNNLGQAFSAQDRYAEADIAYGRALEILEETVGPRDQRVAFTLNNLAYVKKQQGDLDGALALYNRSLQVLERSVGKDHLHVAGVLDNLAVVYKLKGMAKEAQAAIQRAQKIRSRR